MTKKLEVLTMADILSRKYPPKEKLYAVLKDYAADTGDYSPPYDCDGDHGVRVRGEPLDQIIWTGRQWAVTTHGVECRDGTYVIGKNRLWENEKEWGWVRQLGGKVWVDLTDFAEALRIARRHHVKSQK